MTVALAEPFTCSAAGLAHQHWPAPEAAKGNLILLHGIGGGKIAWTDSMGGTGEWLATQGWNVWALDFPGYGGSTAAPCESLVDMARAVLAWMDAQSISKAVFLGHSMGGMVAQELHAFDAQRVQGLILVGTSPAFGRSEGTWQQSFLQARLAPLDAGLGMGHMARTLVPAMVAPIADANRVQACIDMMSAVPEATYRASLQALLRFDQRAQLPLIRVPVLVITGEHDQTAPPVVGQRMAQAIAGAEFALLCGAGHLANLETPQEFHTLTRPFLTRAC
jgi:3-oxoadipate enol-lactonase